MSFLFVILLYQSRDGAKGVSITSVLLTPLSLPVVMAQDAAVVFSWTIDHSDNTTTSADIGREEVETGSKDLAKFFCFLQTFFHKVSNFKLFPFNSWAGISLKWQ